MLNLLTVHPRKHYPEQLGRRLPRSLVPDLGSEHRLGHRLYLCPDDPGLPPLLLLLSNYRLAQTGEDVHLEHRTTKCVGIYATREKKYEVYLIICI